METTKHIPAAPIYRLPRNTKQPGCDTIILYPSKVYMIVDESYQPTILIVTSLPPYSYTYASRDHPRKYLLDSGPCLLIFYPRYPSKGETNYHKDMSANKYFQQ